MLALKSHPVSFLSASERKHSGRVLSSLYLLTSFIISGYQPVLPPLFLPKSTNWPFVFRAMNPCHRMCKHI